MLGALYSGITGMDAAETGMDVIGNNIANVQTTGFKSGTASFASVYADSVSILGGKAGNEEGKGVQVVALNSIWEQGALEQTMNPTDCAISGDGFFQVTENGTEYYTRAGAFRFDATNNLTDPSGRLVQGFDWAGPATPPASTDATGPITIPAGYTDAQIGADGVISALNAAGTRENFATIALFDFPSIDGLRKMTGNLYEESADSGAPTAFISGEAGIGKISNNHLEASNVNLAREFVDLIVTQKAFQANSRVISSSAEMLTEVINIIR
jgi:flagellar hook protein FlgE